MGNRNSAESRVVERPGCKCWSCSARRLEREQLLEAVTVQAIKPVVIAPEPRWSPYGGAL